MPNPPSTDGLPVWLQIAVTLAFFVLSCAVVVRAWKSDKTVHQPTTVAHLADMQPVRDLATHMTALAAAIERLCVREQETEHWTRNHIDELVRVRHAIEENTRALNRWRAD